MHENHIVNLSLSFNKLIHDLNFYVKRKLKQNRKIEFELTLPQFCCLYLIKENKTVTPSKLYPNFNFGIDNLNYTIQKLVRLQLIESSKSDSDKRLVILKITKKGKDVCKILDDIESSLFQLNKEEMIDTIIDKLCLHNYINEKLIEYIGGRINNDKPSNFNRSYR